jgi:hypothetical protein
VSLDDSPLTCDGDGMLEAAERGVLTIALANGSVVPMSETTVTVSTTVPGVTFGQGGSVTLATVEPFGSALATMEVELAPTFTGGALPLTITAANTAACVPTVTLDAAPVVNRNDAGFASTDDVEAGVSAWTPTSTDVWRRIGLDPEDHAWNGADLPAPSDTALESPDLIVGQEPFVVTFQHRYDFETTFDGGVVELSADGGATWLDASSVTDPGYDGTIFEGGGNPLAGRDAFVGRSRVWPSLLEHTLDFGTTFAGQTVRLRFRIGTDESVGAAGWTIDDLAFAGIINTPFPAVAVGSDCVQTTPEPEAGCGCGIARRARVGGALLPIAIVFIFHMRRRTRAGSRRTASPRAPLQSPGGTRRERSCSTAPRPRPEEDVTLPDPSTIRSFVKDIRSPTWVQPSRSKTSSSPTFSGRSKSGLVISRLSEPSVPIE